MVGIDFKAELTRIRLEQEAEGKQQEITGSKSVPSKLRDDAINFCLVAKPVKDERSSGKNPFQNGWQNKELKWNNPELIQWLNQGGNYGVVGGGEKNLIILDFDDETVQKELIEKLPETFTVKTGGGLLHKYYFCDSNKGFRVKGKDNETLVDVQGKSTQVVAPGSVHYTGNTYSIENNDSIATITMEKIHELLDTYNNKKIIQKSKPISQTINKSEDEFLDNLLNGVSFSGLLADAGVDTLRNPTNCPFHSSKGNACLGWDEEKAHCFNCDGAWNKLSWIKQVQDCDAKEAIEWLAEKVGKTEELLEGRKEWNKNKADQNIKDIKKLLLKDEEAEFKENEINWVDEDISWEEMKEDLRIVIKNKDKLFFTCSKTEEITGKPQLIHTSMQEITLVRKTEREEGRKGEEQTVQRIKFIDEGVDKRTDGIIIDSFAKDFWLSKILSNNKEYYLLSEKELPISNCIIKGMLMRVNDLAEMNPNLKLKTISKLFFVHSFEPSVKIISKKEIVDWTKSKKITGELWRDHLDLHPFGTRNRFPELSNVLRSAQILSGKVEGYPLHIAVIGTAGTRKSMGYIETIANKYEEEPKIVEGANSRIKGLSPSFKEKPANIGYLAKCERMGWIDELGKMVEFESNRHDSTVRNVLGELNFLLDNKKRTVGSGNDNDCVVQANSKFIFVSNPISKKRRLANHIGVIDPTTMTRILWWVQDENEKEFVLSKEGIEIKSPLHLETRCSNIGDKTKQIHHIYKCRGDLGSENAFREAEKPYFDFNSFLTLIDTTNSFVCEMDFEEISRINSIVLGLSSEDMAEIWKPRGEHHIKLIIDGIIKHRCLFKDYDETFTVKQEDYDLAERLFISMVKRWETDLGANVRSY